MLADAAQLILLCSFGAQLWLRSGNGCKQQSAAMTKPECSETDESNFVRFAGEYGTRTFAIAEQPNTIQHWQLRDLLSFGADDQHVYTVDGQSVKRLNLDSHKADTFVSCQQPPTSMAVSGDCLATGTDHGLLTVHNISNPNCAPQRVFEDTIAPGGDVLNSLHIVGDSRGGQSSARLYASLNDTTIRCYSLPTMRQQLVIKHDEAVNYCAESPDGSMLISVGDTPMVNVFQRDTTGRFVQTGKLRSDARDAGMCCSWNQWGSVFATAHQCGHVLVWDPRQQSGRTVSTHEVSSAVRSVKFCEAPVDLLAFAEHDAVFHVLDARKFRIRQSIRHPDNQNAGISGIAFAPGGTRLFVGVENRGVQEWAVDSTSRRGFSGTLAS